MFEDKNLTDFKLKCSDDEVLTCHKVILAARSPVFYAMMSIDMKEAQQGFAEVPDFDSKLMEQVLHFIYCNKVINLEELSYQLIFAAEKYELKELKRMCIEHIIKNLKIENVTESLIISNRISGSDKMFTKCADFVMK